MRQTIKIHIKITIKIKLQFKTKNKNKFYFKQIKSHLNVQLSPKYAFWTKSFYMFFLNKRTISINNKQIIDNNLHSKIAIDLLFAIQSRKANSIIKHTIVL